MERREKIGRDGGRGEYLVGGVFIGFKMIRGERRGEIFWARVETFFGSVILTDGFFLVYCFRVHRKNRNKIHSSMASKAINIRMRIRTGS